MRVVYVCVCHSLSPPLHTRARAHTHTHTHTRTQAFLHLAMTGAVVHVSESNVRTALTDPEMRLLFARFHALCEQASLHHTYRCAHELGFRV